MAYSPPRTWTSGEKPTAAQMNQEVRDNVAALANPPACRVYHNTTQSVNDNSLTTVVFNSERYDTDSMHSTSSNTSRITINKAGVYVVTFNALFASRNDFFIIYADLRLNGATTLAAEQNGSFNGISTSPAISLVTTYKFALNDYVEARVYHDNNANAAVNLQSTGNMSPEFAATFVGLG